MTTTKTTPPEIERLKFSALVINPVYSGRSEKEIAENAKEKAKELAAFGGWNPAMPGHYFIDPEGKKVLLAGFSRVEGSKINGEKEGYFVKVDGDEVDHLLACETTNSVKPLSPLSRGARYAQLRDGAIADDFAGAIADPAKPEDWKRQPMTLAQIGERIGKTGEWVRRCIVLFESPEPIRELLETNQISVKVVEKSKALADRHHEGSESKQLAMCKRAAANARADNKETATEKHFDAIKAEFTPAPKLVADGEPEEDKPAKSKKSKSNASDDAGTLPTGDDEPEPTLFKDAPILTEGKKENKKLREMIVTLLMDTENTEGVVLEPDTCEALAGKIVDAVKTASEVF